MRAHRDGNILPPPEEIKLAYPWHSRKSAGSKGWPHHKIESWLRSHYSKSWTARVRNILRLLALYEYAILTLVEQLEDCEVQYVAAIVKKVAYFHNPIRACYRDLDKLKSIPVKRDSTGKIISLDARIRAAQEQRLRKLAQEESK